MPSSQWDQYKAAPATGNQWDQYKQQEPTPPTSGSIRTPVPEPAGLQGPETFGDTIRSISTPQSAIDMAKGVGKGVISTIRSANPAMARGFGPGGDLVNTDASNQAERVGKIVEGGAEMAAPIGVGMPSAARAGGVLNDIATQAHNVPVMTRNAEAPLQRLTEIAGRGGKMPGSANSLLTRSQAVSPMTFPEARDYYSNIAGTARDELSSMSKPIARQYGLMKQGLHQDLTDAADTLGRGSDYSGAIKEYSNAKRLGEAGQTLVKKVLPAGGVLGAGKLLYDKMRSH